MAVFKPNASKPIVWNWINNDLEICPHEIQAAIEHERDCEKTDLNLGFGSTAIGVLSTAALLGLAGVGFAMVPPVALAIAGALHGYNAGIQSRRRELESEFIEDHPDILEAIENKLNQGQSSAKVASAYESIFRLYRRGDDEGIVKVLGNSQTSNQSQQGIQPFDNAESTKAKDEALGISGIQPIGIAQDAIKATAPSYGVSKVLSPLDRILASPYQSRAWFGAQRTGKSYLAAIASQQMNKIKGTQVFHINLYSFGDEDDKYFVHAVMSVRGDLTHLSGHEAQSLITKAYNVVTAFKKVKDAILIVDEITMTGATSSAHKEAVLPLMQEIAALGSVLASTGKKRKQALWTLSPDFVAGSLTQEAKSIKSLTISFVAIPPGKSIDWEGQAIGFHAESFTNVQRNFPALGDAPFMDCDRMVFLDGLWLDMGHLPDLITKEPIAPQSSNLLPGEAEFVAKLYEYSEPVADELWKPAIDWRETFAKSLPADLSENEFKQRYQLERMLHESPSLEVPKEQPIGIDCKPIATLHDYLKRRGPKSLKPITSAMRNTNAISETDLDEELERHDNYQDGIHQLLVYGCEKGFFICDSEGNFSALEKH